MDVSKPVDKGDLRERQVRVDQPEGQTGVKVYFRRLRLRLKIGLMIAFLVPLAALFAFFHFQFQFTLKETGKLNLTALAESQRNTVDLFLQERVVNLFSLFHSPGFDLNPSMSKMESYLRNLRQVSDAFIDVGFLDSSGLQKGYVGPFPFLHDKDYSGESWFGTLISQDRNYFISDIYLGFRNKPHFTIAVKQLIDGHYYIMRSTLDPDKLYVFLRTISHGKGVESALINQDGHYQVVDPAEGKLFGLSEFIPSEQEVTGVKEIRIKGEQVLIAHAWLKETPWALLVRQPVSLAHTQMQQARNFILGAMVLIIVLVAAAMWVITNRLIGEAEATAETRDELKYQLLHASKLASVGELAAGVAHEINNPLAIINATSGVIRDMLDPDLDIEGGPENILEELDGIDTAVFRAREITHKLLDFARKRESVLVPSNVNEILNDAMSGLKEREFAVSNIEIIRDYDPNLPEIELDPDQIRQVFLNLINNAGDAIEESGQITISTRHQDGKTMITIADTGRGMTPEQMKNIFIPFYTTKEVGKGTGLGLSVSLSIVESMGGTIDVQSMPGAGSSFIVSIPDIKSEEAVDGPE